MAPRPDRLALAIGLLALAAVGCSVASGPVPVAVPAPPNTADVAGGWALGGLDLRYEAHASDLDPVRARAAVVAARAIADPLARARAELDGRTVAPAAPVTVPAAPVDAAAARARVLELRAITDPVARAQAELGEASTAR